MPKFSTKQYFFLLTSLLLLVFIYTLFKPFVISIDSVYGFLAYKGTRLYHTFNVVGEVSSNNISQTNLVFQSWWSPGQWFFPGMLNYFFGTRLGIASIIITVLFCAAGFWGYYKLFIFFGFSTRVTLFSLLLIFSSSTFYYSFIIYQGGEILEFGVFPWFLLYIIKIKKITVNVLFAVTSLLLLCFFAKTTLLLYCAIILLFKVIEPLRQNHIQTKEVKYDENFYLLLIPLAFFFAAIYFLFLSKGTIPSDFRHFGLSLDDILIPLTAPVSSILSIQQWIIRIEKIILSFGHHPSYSVFISAAFYSLVLAIVVAVGFAIFREKRINSGYKFLLLFLYIGLSSFFILAYSFNTNISYSSRHFKLLGFLFIPGSLTILQYKLKSDWINLGVLLFCILAVSDILYLKQKWTASRYISINYFYRDFDNLISIDDMDENSYKKLIDIDRSKDNKDAIFYIESNLDVAMDIRHTCIIQKPAENIFAKSFHGIGPAIIICLSKKTLGRYENIMKKNFPDYNYFQLIAETSNYRFFVAEYH